MEVDYAISIYTFMRFLPQLLLQLLRPRVPLPQPRLELPDPPFPGLRLQRERLHLAPQLGLVPRRRVARRQGELQV